MVKMIMRVMCAASTWPQHCVWTLGSAGLLDAPWCAVKNLGSGDICWDCQYRTFEACYPNALADRGFCNVNPWPGPATAVVRPRHPKRYARDH
jgi:hypothetical protein